ncbi:MAG: tetratricopeptide repeat protein, partial [Chloroflexi bacterium]|nr:tetratricopeptide repeat protein [Chloroflexota bacterium]
RDYTQPFFRQTNRRRNRNLFIVAVLLTLLVGALVWQWDALTASLSSLGSPPPTPTPRPSQRAARATQLITDNELLAAEAELAQAVAERPRSIAYLYEHGRLLIELERYTEALELGATITNLDARDERGFALQAAALTWQGQAPLAIPIALSGLELNPRFTPLHAALTRAYVDTDRWTEALETGERGLSVSPDDADLLRAYAYALQSVGAYEEAISHLQRAIELRPTYLPTQLELAGLYLARDENSSAIDLYNRILSIDPRHARGLLRLCLAYRKVGEFARALGFCKDSVENDPSAAAAQFQLGLLHYRERQFNESRAAFQDCLTHDDGAYDLSCRYRLGLSHYYTGDCTRGWSLLRESLALAQANGDVATTRNVLQGLAAIESDPACIDDAAAPVTFQE